MDSEEEDYEFNLDSLEPFEIDQAVLFGDHKANTTPPTFSFSSDQEDTLSPVSRRPLLLQAMDISSVRRPPVSVMTPADRVSAHDLPLAEPLSEKGVEREKYHIIIIYLAKADACPMHTAYRLPPMPTFNFADIFTNAISSFI